jgi:hypothetical protein
MKKCALHAIETKKSKTINHRDTEKIENTSHVFLCVSVPLWLMVLCFFVIIVAQD